MCKSVNIFVLPMLSRGFNSSLHLSLTDPLFLIFIRANEDNLTVNDHGQDYGLSLNAMADYMYCLETIQHFANCGKTASTSIMLSLLI